MKFKIYPDYEFILIIYKSNGLILVMINW